MPFAARVIVEANTTMFANSTSIHSGQCNIVLKESGAAQPVDIGQRVFFEQSTTAPDTVVHMTGAADVPPGTYDATLQCSADTSEAYRSDLVAIAAAR